MIYDIALLYIRIRLDVYTYTRLNDGDVKIKCLRAYEVLALLKKCKYCGSFIIVWGIAENNNEIILEEKAKKTALYSQSIILKSRLLYT